MPLHIPNKSIFSSCPDRDAYRYGFNGMEKDDEMKGSGNFYDFGARIYDSRVGRWLAIDPQASKYTFASPYNYTLNNPIWFIDPNGEEVTIKDKSSVRAVLNTLTSKEIRRIKVRNDGTLKIRGKRNGSGNMQALRQLIDSDRNYNVMTSFTYESKVGTVTLPLTTGGRTVVPNAPRPQLSSPNDDIYVVIKPTTDSGSGEVAAHELLGHASLYDEYEDGDNTKYPWHQYSRTTGKDENINTTSGHLWVRVSEARRNYKEGKDDKKRARRIERRENKFEKSIKKNEN